MKSIIRLLAPMLVFAIACFGGFKLSVYYYHGQLDDMELTALIIILFLAYLTVVEVINEKL